MTCALCHRDAETSRHHLIPRTLHSNKWFKKRFSREEMARTIPVCHECHRAIHQAVPDEKALAREYNTLEKLLGCEEIARFVVWASRRSGASAEEDGCSG